MEQVVINSSATTVQATNQKQSKSNSLEEQSLFAMVLQGLTTANINQPLIELIGENLTGSESSQTLTQIINILESSKQPNQDLMMWFKGLTNEEQKNVFQLLTTLGNSDNKIDFSFMQPDDKVKLQSLVDYKKEISLFLQNIKEVFSSKYNTKNEQFILGELQQNNSNILAEKEKIVIRNQNLFIRQMQQSHFVNYSNDSSMQQDINLEPIDLNQLQYQYLNTQITESKTSEVNLSKQQVVETLVSNQNFSSELGKIIIRNLTLPNGISETKIQLHPQELGQIDVRLIAEKGQISAQIVAETLMGKELLEGQINQLKQALIHQGYQVERIEVQHVTSSSSTLGQEFRNGFNFSGQQSFKQHSGENHSSPYSATYTEEVDEFGRELFSTSGIDYTV